ncbi:hypothetical protein KR084_003961, partial [Drosophila pseudotakahashii]
ILKRILKEDLVRNFDCVIGKEIMINFNYDGLQDKKPFKKYEALNQALYGMYTYI